MVSEIRFRDVLTNESNITIFSNILEKILNESGFKFNLITNELPIARDVIGLQPKYSDIVGFDENNNIYFIELKRQITKRNMNSTLIQVDGYVELFKDSISRIKNKDKLYFYDYILLKYLDFVNFDYREINDINSVIISINEINDEIDGTDNKYGFLDEKIRKKMLKNFLANKSKSFLKTYKKQLNTDLSSFLNNVMKKEAIDSSTYFPLVITKKNHYSLNNLKINFEIIFENIFDEKKIVLDITKDFESLDSQINKNKINYTDYNIPELFNQFKPSEIFNEVNRYFKNAKSRNQDLEFVIQTFRSGRSFPIIYLQLCDNLYLALMQIKPVVVSIGSLVNRSIVYDCKSDIDEQRDTYYNDVILFDTGKYEIRSINEHGVKFYTIILTGKKINYEFHAYSPKFKAVPELLPYMSPKKVKNHLNKVNKKEGETYLFKNNAEDDTQWITSKLNIKN